LIQAVELQAIVFDLSECIHQPLLKEPARPVNSGEDIVARRRKTEAARLENGRVLAGL
jgi:hypothetical protein